MGDLSECHLSQSVKNEKDSIELQDKRRIEENTSPPSSIFYIIVHISGRKAVKPKRTVYVLHPQITATTTQYNGKMLGRKHRSKAMEAV